MKRRIISLILVGLIYNPFTGFSQDSIPKTSNLKEESFLKFQDYFFKALAQKSIYNYRVAIQNLEKCNSLKPKDVSVLFELSKNFLALKKNIEAEEFALQALVIEPTNYWILKHLSKVYITSRNIKKSTSYSRKNCVTKSKRKREIGVFVLPKQSI